MFTNNSNSKKEKKVRKKCLSPLNQINEFYYVLVNSISTLSKPIVFFHERIWQRELQLKDDQ